MSCLTLALSIFFRLKHRRVNSLLKNLSANVSDKTFNVFNPYPEQRKIISARALLMVIITLAPWFLAFLVLLIYAMSPGFLISLILLLICLHSIFTDLASETYQNAKIFIKSVHNNSGWGVGDLEVTQKLKRIMPRLSNYYLVLSVLFLTFAVTVDYISSSLLWLLFQPIVLIFEVSKATGVIGWQVAGLLYAALVLVFLPWLAWKIKNKVLSYIVGPSNLESWEIKRRIT